jgi:hypothetical protein
MTSCQRQTTISACAEAKRPACQAIDKHIRWRLLREKLAEPVALTTCRFSTSIRRRNGELDDDASLNKRCMSSSQTLASIKPLFIALE